MLPRELSASVSLEEPSERFHSGRIPLSAPKMASNKQKTIPIRRSLITFMELSVRISCGRNLVERPRANYNAGTASTEVKQEQKGWRLGVSKSLKL